ncbi:hypothetical protein TrLO_g7674 [Triparma laevis f. longispina]|uniref:RRM domain-containing protein n=2 Tax=Triparma laevis TaxID=1534972 RepID=A0A9W6ZN44_9STRA|nr:hypothetical protein TrLO_g7674 [Triparma laevis f. longispina]
MSRWADADDPSLPPAPYTSPLQNGRQTTTSYSIDSKTGQKMKTVKTVKVWEEVRKVNKRVKARSERMKRFGLASGEEEQENVTIQSRDVITIEDPNIENTGDGEAEDPGKALAGNLNAFWAKQQRRQLERKYDVNGEPEEEEGGEGGNKYVPPGQRAAGGGAKTSGGLAAMADKIEASGGGDKKYDDRDANTIRCTNISEETTEKDLQELFKDFGRISRVYLAKDRETMQSRGFAFISFVHHADAQNAMDALQGYGYDHLILKLEWARPSGGKGDAGTETTQFRSGYGKALAQDTKEKVSFASNLTTNK